MTGSAADIFISYKAEDRARLQPLVAALQAEGFSLWWDAHIGAGTHWREDIQEHLDAAKCVIVVWSKRSVGHDGNFVRDEASRAQRRDAYLPIRIDPVEPPLGFGEVQATSLTGWKGNRTDPRFRALVNAVQACISGEHGWHPPEYLSEPRVTRRVAIAGGIGIGGIAVAGVGGWLLLKPGEANAKRIAVLPFANMSSDKEQAYFSEGVAEELRAALSRIGMEVIGRASSEAVKELDTKSAASKLGVAHILTGSVRRSPETIRVNAQLVAGKDGVERWAQSYDRAPGDAIKIQTDIATNVAQALSVTLGQAARAAIALGGTADSAAQDLVMRGLEIRRKTDSEEGYVESLALFNEAIDRDPNYAEAYVLKASILDGLGIRYLKSPADGADKLAQAADAANRAITLAPRLGFAHAVLATIELDRFNFASALQYMRQGLALSPDDPRVIRSATSILPYISDAREALNLSDRLVALDPLDARTFGSRAQMLRDLRQYPQSIEAARKSLELAPQRTSLYFMIGDSLTLMNRPAEARAAYKKLPEGNPFRMTGEAILEARAGNHANAERTLARFRGEFGAAWSYQYAQIYAQAGKRDQAFAELDNAVQAKDPGLTGLKVDPFLDPIRGDPRFAAMVRKLNFP